MEKYVPVYIEGGTASCGDASNEQEARECAWKYIPDDVKKQIGDINNLEAMRYKTQWIVL